MSLPSTLHWRTVVRGSVVDKRVDGTLWRYCATCDDWYEAGTYKAHQNGSKHIAFRRDAIKMAEWYARNGS